MKPSRWSSTKREKCCQLEGQGIPGSLFDAQNVELHQVRMMGDIMGISWTIPSNLMVGSEHG